MTGRFNQAALWHLQLCARLLDRAGYHLPSAHVHSAIDALLRHAVSDEEISQLDLENDDRVHLALELFRKHGSMSMSDDQDSTNTK
jgi:hypothetical protein